MTIIIEIKIIPLLINILPCLTAKWDPAHAPIKLDINMVNINVSDTVEPRYKMAVEISVSGIAAATSVALASKNDL